jgi:hypothetical protein
MEPFVIVRGRPAEGWGDHERGRLRGRAAAHGPVLPDAKLQSGLPATLEYWGNRSRLAKDAEDVDDEIEAATPTDSTSAAQVAVAAAVLPGAHENWSPQWKAQASAFRYLTALRQAPPGIKSFG